MYHLRDLAHQFDTKLIGDGTLSIKRVAALETAIAGDISFLANKKYQRFLATTKASAVILTADLASQCPVAALISTNPYLTYAKIARLLNPPETFQPGQDVHAIVAKDAVIDPTAWIGPGTVIESQAVIGAGVFIGPQCLVGKGCRIGANSRLVGRVTLCEDTELGQNVLIHPGAVLGSDGFGFAHDGESWVKVPQLGRLRIGDHVEIGANTTIDRGSLADTQIEIGVKLDNQIQIGHNVRIGAHSAIAGCVGIAGSTRVGQHCLLGGGVGLAGHIELADHVRITGQSLVTRSFHKPGQYSGNLPAVPSRLWRKMIAHLRQIDDMMRRLRALEQRVLFGQERSSK